MLTIVYRFFKAVYYWQIRNTCLDKIAKTELVKRPFQRKDKEEDKKKSNKNWIRSANKSEKDNETNSLVDLVYIRKKLFKKGINLMAEM